MNGSARSDSDDSDLNAEATPEQGLDDRTFQHTPVMRDEIVADFETVPPGFVLDATIGGAGHAHAVLVAWPRLSVVGIDRDPAALEAAGQRLAEFGDRSRLARSRFDQLGAVLDDLEISELSGFLFDLGVSSPQLDWSDRGFSFRNDGPLDMRMDTDGPRTAADFVNEAPQSEISKVLRTNADERFATRIAAAIVANRPIHSTATLAEVVVNAIPAPARRKGGHPAKRTFQALRIEINDELSILAPALDEALDRLMPGGRGLVLTYHSGEDRIVKQVFRERTAQPVPPGLPVDPEPADFVSLRPLSRRPSPAELDHNPRSASARLRGIERRAEAA